MKARFAISLLANLEGCAPTEDEASERPPYDGEILAAEAGKADGAGSRVTVRTRTSGFRGADPYGSPCYDYFDWTYEEWAAAAAVASWTWRASRSFSNYVGGGNVDFRYRVDPAAAPCQASWTSNETVTPDSWDKPAVTVVQKW